jgi:hypothetical protein
VEEIMKVVAKPIDMVCWIDSKGNICPIRFRYTEGDESYKVIKIDKVVSKDIEKFCGNNMLVFTCLSQIEGIQKKYELKYELSTCKWMLFKI